MLISIINKNFGIDSFSFISFFECPIDTEALRRKCCNRPISAKRVVKGNQINKEYKNGFLKNMIETI